MVSLESTFYAFFFSLALLLRVQFKDRNNTIQNLCHTSSFECHNPEETAKRCSENKASIVSRPTLPPLAVINFEQARQKSLLHN